MPVLPFAPVHLRAAAYTSPSGTRVTFDCDDVQPEHDRRRSVFNVSALGKACVQQKGFGPRRYPMRCFFSGRDHARIAAAFEKALLEPGFGRLEHPVYSVTLGKGEALDVIPFGPITRYGNPRSAADQTIVDVTFWTTLRDVYPRDWKSDILSAVAGFKVVAARQFAGSASLAGAVKRASAKTTVRRFLTDVNATLQPTADAAEASARREFDDGFRLVNSGIDVSIRQPLLLAKQIGNLILTSASELSGSASRLEGYAALAERIFGSKVGCPSEPVTALAVNRDKLVNDFLIAELFAMNSVAGSVLSVVNSKFATRPEALAAMDEVLQQFDAAVAWRDSGFAALGIVDTGESYQSLREAVVLAAGYLIQVSYKVVPEQRIVVDRVRTIIDIALELYGDVDAATIKQLINSNDLTGSEYMELPAGRSIRYYPRPEPSTIPDLTPTDLFKRYAASIAYCCVRSSDGLESIGSAFHVGEGVFLTARHVVENKTIVEIATESNLYVPDGAPTERPPRNRATRVVGRIVRGPLFHPDASVDVAAIVVDGPSLPPAVPLGSNLDDWLNDDEFVLREVVVMGFPPIPFSREPVIVAARAEINAVIDKYSGRHPHFVISSMARGGFSGGPCLIQWDFVVGLVTEALLLNDQPAELGYMAVISVEPLFVCMQAHGIVPVIQKAGWDGLWD